ncbi:MAG: OsmC family protein [Ginsengibacter sp.]
MASNSIKVDFKSGMNFSTNINGHLLQIDQDESAGGTDLGPRPKALMLASLGGCTGFDIVSILNKMRVTFSNFSINIEGNLSDTEPAIYNKVMLNYIIMVDEADEPKMEKAVKLSKEKYCGVSKMFESFAEVAFTITYL